MVLVYTCADPNEVSKEWKTAKACRSIPMHGQHVATVPQLLPERDGTPHSKPSRPPCTMPPDILLHQLTVPNLSTTLFAPPLTTGHLKNFILAATRHVDVLWVLFLKRYPQHPWAKTHIRDDSTQRPSDITQPPFNCHLLDEMLVILGRFFLEL